MTIDFVELAERVGKAHGPDRELDALLEVQARRLEAYAVGLNDETRAQWRASPDGMVSDQDAIYHAPRFTASIDAALGLVERLLPEWHVEIYGASSKTAAVKIEPLLRRDGGAAWSPNDLSPPLAIISALLAALQDTTHAK